MKKTVIFFAAAAMLCVSCDLDRILTTVPESQLSAESYFKTAEDLQLFSNTFYNNLLEKEPYSVESDFFVKRNPSNLIRGGNDRTVPSTGGGWSFTNLRKMNTLLANIKNCNDEAAVKEYSALTKFWRAFYYADMVAKFGDVPWIDHEIGSADDDLYAPRDSRETVLQNIIKDIDEAIAGLPEPAKSPQTAYRVNKYTAMFLKCQFCLFEGTFRKYHKDPAPFATSYTAKDGSTHTPEYYLSLAVDAAQKLMDANVYKIHSTGKADSDYVTLFNATDATPDEIILAINYDVNLKFKHDCSRAITNQTAARFGMTKKLVDQYLMKDGSRFTDKPGWNVLPFAEEVADRDPRLAQTIRTPGYSWQAGKQDGPEFAFCQTGYHTIKYVQSYESKCYSTDNSTNDMPVYRYAELLLNYVEAKAELGTITQDDIDKTVNQIRKRVGMPDLKLEGLKSDPYLLSEDTGYPNVKGHPQEAVILEIRRERAIELFQEGYGRYFDLIRWKAGYCINQPMYGMYIPGPGDYKFGDKSDYTFYVGSTTSTKTSFKIYDPQSGTVEQDMVFLVDPNTGTDATAGVMDPMRTIGHNFDESKHYFYPIPSNELLLNKNLVQNPGWGK